MAAGRQCKIQRRYWKLLHSKGSTICSSEKLWDVQLITQHMISTQRKRLLVENLIATEKNDETTVYQSQHNL
ncbi:hypothetical protein CCR75_007466 [Bremia lactucae]|uniref:Uncharacterized protein n=1 Tax=Bremia lactucae TaxID=4779 RepID=A0A976FJR8_BRELC|nr:hypothetical protein CCR75_007466 [Bremia lactucae]